MQESSRSNERKLHIEHTAELQAVIDRLPGVLGITGEVWRMPPEWVAPQLEVRIRCDLLGFTRATIASPEMLDKFFAERLWYWENLVKEFWFSIAVECLRSA